MQDNSTAGGISALADLAPEQLARVELLALVAWLRAEHTRLAAENGELRERLRRRRCGTCGATQRWRTPGR
jgi:hypothetical protein